MAYKGTTTVGVVCKDGVILASDTRVTMGYLVAHKKGKKIHKIDEHLAVTIAGGLADAQRTVDILRANASLYKLTTGREMPASAAARLVANVLFSTRYYPYLTRILIGGKDTDGYHIYSLDPLGSVTKEDCVATGSGSPIAYGVLEDQYRKDKTVEELLPVVVRAVDSAMKRDIASGDSFDVAIISEEGYRELTEEEKKKILDESR
ncbi:MAG TPA: archaeal proteasome endopeptidase complex subunit beta [Candidatus Bathyarchaeota archaeon]|nr:archaeal proteasome endopeptidase complex subunit beta [Candidatus Bathyarchaeota archaeon]